MPVTISGSTGITNVDGSAAAPAEKGTTSSTAGMFFPAADTVAISTASTERMRVNSSGNVGIGTSSPGTLLSIEGTSNIKHLYTGANGGILFGQYNSTGDAQIQNQSTGGVIAFATNNSERMRITSAGNVGIGTTSPSGKLDVASRGITKGSMPTGSVLQVISTAKTSTSSVANSGSTFVEIDTAFRVTITPSTSSNTILLSCGVTAGATGGTVRYKLQYSTDSGSTFNDVTPLADANSSHGQAHFGYPTNSDTNQVTSVFIELLHSPATTSSIIYRVMFGGDLNQTYQFNRSVNYPNSFLGSGYVSTITAKEIAV